MLTAEGAYQRYEVGLIGSRTPHMPWVKFVAVYNTVRRDWLKDKAAEKETDYVKQLLRPFRRAETLEKPGRTVDLTQLPGGVSALRAVLCDFATPHGALQGRPCKALTDDQLNAEDDPNARGDDWFPRYIDDDQQAMRILSDTEPTALTIRYLLMPPDLKDDQPGQQLLETPTAVDEILRRLMADNALTTSQPNYSALSGQDIPKREVNP